MTRFGDTMFGRAGGAAGLGLALALSMALAAAAPACAQERVGHFGLAAEEPQGFARDPARAPARDAAPAMVEPGTPVPPPEGPVLLVVRSTTDLEIMAPALRAFVARTPSVGVRYEQWGSNALSEASQAACVTGQSAADAVFSSAVHQMVELVNHACAQPYRSDLTQALPTTRRWRDELWGLTHEPVVIAYNRDLVAPGDAPRSRFALLDLMRRGDPLYHGRIATYDIEASGLGYLLAYADSQEATSFGAILEGFARVGAVATCCSAEILADVASGRYLIAYNVLGSYVSQINDPSLGIILPEDYTLFLSRAYMIPRGAAHPQVAALLLDFLLSPEGQGIMAEQGLIVQADPDQHSLPESAERAIRIEPTLLVARDQHHRRRFIAQWRQTFDTADPHP